MAGKSGQNFERKVSKLLSKWWTGKKRDDIFWRTQGSGSRATCRSKAGKKTQGQYGDLCASDPLGKPLTDLIVWSLKKGTCRGTTIQDLFDLLPNSKLGPIGWPGWIKECQDMAKEAGTFSWALLVQRTNRRAIIAAPTRLLTILEIPWLGTFSADQETIGILKFEHQFLMFGRPEKVIWAADYYVH